MGSYMRDVEQQPGDVRAYRITTEEARLVASKRSEAKQRKRWETMVEKHAIMGKTMDEAIAQLLTVGHASDCDSITAEEMEYRTEEIYTRLVKILTENLSPIVEDFDDGVEFAKNCK